MLRNLFPNLFTITILMLLFTTSVTLANPASENSNLNVTSLDKALHIEDGFSAISTSWSPDGQYLLVTYSKSPSYLVKQYLLDTYSHTFGEINYGIEESETNGILEAKWVSTGKKIYFQVSKSRPNSGICYIICNPDGTNLRCIGTNSTDLSAVMTNVGNIGFQRNINWNSNSSRIVFEWQKPGNASTGVYIANGDGTKARKIFSAIDPQPIFYDSNKIFVHTDEGTVDLINENGNVIQTFQPKNESEQYCAYSLSPDRKKILMLSGLPGSFDLQTYISNIDGSNLKGRISYYDGKDTEVLIKEYWQPNDSCLLVNNNGNLYIVEGATNNRRLLYEGNASKPQWFPNGEKIAFIENRNKLYSIDTDGTNLTFITNLGLTSSYFWDIFWDPLDKAKQFSISSSGSTIVFTSALYPDTGKLIEKEPDSSKLQGIAAPLFIVNSDGSNLTQVTPRIKGRHDIFREWSPDGTQLTIGSILFSSNSNWDSGESFVVKLNTKNSSFIWKNLPANEIYGSKELSTIDKNKTEEPNSANTSQSLNVTQSLNTSQVTEHEETSRQSPSFVFLQLLICIAGVWLTHKNWKT